MPLVADRRVLEAYARGFRHVYFDDNYPSAAVAEFFTVKMACDGSLAVDEAVVGRHRRRDQPRSFRFANGMGPSGNVDWRVDEAQRHNMSAALRAVAEVYFEVRVLGGHRAPLSAERCTPLPIPPLTNVRVESCCTAAAALAGRPDPLPDKESAARSRT